MGRGALPLLSTRRQSILFDTLGRAIAWTARVLLLVRYYLYDFKNSISIIAVMNTKRYERLFLFISILSYERLLEMQNLSSFIQGVW